MSIQPLMYKVSLFLFFVIAPVQLFAYSFTPEFGVDVRQESNVAKDQTELEDTVVTPNLGLKFSETNASINTNIDLFAKYEDYQDNTFDSKGFYDVNAFLDWIFIPERLTWAFEDYATTQRVNILGTEIPDNLQTINVFSTGPDLSYQHEVWTYLAKFRYGDTSYSTSKADSTFLSLSGAIRKDINEYSRATAGLVFRSNDFDEKFQNDYDVYKAFISYSRDLPTGDFLADFGFNSVEIDQGVEEDQPYLKLQMTMQPAGSFTLDLNLSDELTDAVGQAFSATETRIVDETEDLFAPLSDFTSTGIYRSRYGLLGLGYQGGRFSWGASASSSDKDYIDNRTDSADIAGRLYANYLFTSLFSFNLGGSFQEVDYDESNTTAAITDEITRGYASFNYRFTDTISTRLGFSTEERTSTDITRDFTDDIVFFSLKYKGAVK